MATRKTLNSDGNITIGTQVDMYGINEGLYKIQKSWKKLQHFLMYSGLSTVGLMKLGKAAIDASSDLVEVQNIVDVAFGEMSYKVEDFASRCIESFGMSELSAKQTAGAFMEMGKAIGLSLEDASNMSLKLTGLTSDMSSFYNISQEYARVALSAVYTGETETLKRYGIILTEANLQEYANTLGIKTKVKAMDAATKVMLRYQYILEATKDIEGDFVRTQHTWANQVRLLKQQWTVFLTVLGNGLTTVFLPLVQHLNAVVKAMTQFLTILQAILSNIFGINFNQVASANGGIADSALDAAAAEDELAESLKGAGKAAKKQLAPFDELNNLQTATAGGGSGETSYDFDIAPYEMGANKLSKLLDDLWSKINTFFGMGRYINKKLQDLLDDIDWEKVFSKARKFGINFADFLNGLISPELFGKVGKTIANALNTAIYAALAFGEEFNWKNLGYSIANGINNFFEHFDVKSFAHSINVFLKGFGDMLLAGIKTLDWELIGQRIGEFLLGIDWFAIAGKAAKVFFEAFSGFMSVYGRTFNTAPIETSLLSLFTGFSLLTRLSKSAALADITKNLTGLFNVMTKKSTVFAEFAVNASKPELGLTLLGNAIDKTQKILKNTKNMFRIPAVQIANFTDNVGSGIFTVKESLKIMKDSTGRAFKNIGKQINQTASEFSMLTKVIVGVGGSIAEFSVVRDAVKQLTLGTEDLGKNLAKIIGIVTAVGAAFTTVFGVPAGIIIAGVVAAIAAVTGFMQAINEINEARVLDALTTQVEGTTHSLDDFRYAMYETVDNVTQGLDTLHEKAQSIGSTKDTLNSLVTSFDSITIAMQTSNELTSTEIETLKANVESLRSTWRSYIDETYDYAIQQTMADMSYMKTQESWTEEMEKAYAEEIANLYLRKEAAVESANAATDSVQQAVDAYLKLKEEGTATQADFDILVSAIQGANSALAEYTGTVENVPDVSEAIQGIERLQGALDLSDLDVDNLDSLSIKFGETVTDIANSADEGYAALATYRQDLEEQGRFTGLAVEAWESRFAELTTAQTTALNQIQADALSKGKDIIAQALEDFEDPSKVNWWERVVVYDNSADAYAQAQFKKYVDNVITGENGLEGKLKEAYDNLPGDVEPYISDALNNIMESIATIPSETSAWNQLSSDWESKYIEAVENVKTGQYEAKLNEFGEWTIQGYNDGVTENLGTSEDLMDEWMDKINTAIYTNDHLTYGSPSPTTHQYGVWTIEGYNEGIDEGIKNSTALRSIYTWMDSLCIAIKAGVNNIIDYVNYALDALSTLSTVPVNVPNGPKINVPTTRIPRLAKGAVIPPNREFMAILGDQTHGTNIEAPLDTIVSAFNMARGNEEDLLREQNQLLRQLLEKEWNISPRDVFNAVKIENNDFKNRTGSSAF